jgi:hypothetical protein
MSDELVEQSVQPFKPTLGMEKWLDIQIEIKSDSPTEISIESGLSKTNWYEWLKRPGFKDWYYAEYEKRTREWRPYLDSIGLKRAKHDFNYWKEMQKIAGRTETQEINQQFNKFEVVNQDGAQINIK